MYHFKVKEELFNNHQINIPDNEINVYSAYWESDFRKHKKRYLKNIIVEDEDSEQDQLSYQSDANLNLKNLILFLRFEDVNNFAFSADHAYTSISKRYEILNLMSKKKLPKIRRELRAMCLSKHHQKGLTLHSYLLKPQKIT